MNLTVSQIAAPIAIVLCGIAYLLLVHLDGKYPERNVDGARWAAGMFTILAIVWTFDTYGAFG